MTDAERLALAGKSDEEVFSFGRKMRGFFDRPTFSPMVCEEAKKRAGFI